MTQTETATSSASTPNIAPDATIGAVVKALPHLRLRPECPVDNLLSMMAHSGKRIAAVVEKDGTFCGFVTRSALLGKLIIDQGFDVGYRIDTSTLHGMIAADVMIPNPAFLASELSIADALAIMTECGYHAMPVLEEQGKLVGLAEMRQLIDLHQTATNDLVESKDNLLSYLMHHESYGLCSPVSTEAAPRNHN